MPSSWHAAWSLTNIFPIVTLQHLYSIRPNRSKISIAHCVKSQNDLARQFAKERKKKAVQIEIHKLQISSTVDYVL